MKLQRSALISILGLACSPAFAANDTSTSESSCIISRTALILNSITQNTGRALPNPCKPLWNRIAISGGINIDAGKWGSENANIQGENVQRASINDAYLNVSATLSNWVSLFGSVSAETATIRSNPDSYKKFGAAEYSASYSNNINSDSNVPVHLEQAFATFGNFNILPIYLQIGQQFQDFSRYQIHPISYTLTQVMSEILAPSAKIGFIEQGFNGSLFVFRDPINKQSSFSKVANYGIAFGYEVPIDDISWQVGGAYLYNLIGANNVAYQVANFSSRGGTLFDDGFYHTRVSALALYGDVSAGPFTLGARYTQTLMRFNVNDLPKNGIADLTGGNIFGAPIVGSDGAKPWSFDVQTSYAYHVWTKDQKLFVGYQTSRQAAGLDLPKHRSILGYGINVIRNINLDVEWNHDWAYKASQGGRNKNSNLVSLRGELTFV